MQITGWACLGNDHWACMVGPAYVEVRRNEAGEWRGEVFRSLYAVTLDAEDPKKDMLLKVAAHFRQMADLAESHAKEGGKT